MVIVGKFAAFFHVAFYEYDAIKGQDAIPVNHQEVDYTKSFHVHLNTIYTSK